MGQKLSPTRLFRSSPNTDRFYTFYISQGSVATQLKCGGMFSNQFITNFPQNAPVKKFWQSVSIWQRCGQNFVAYLFGRPSIYRTRWGTSIYEDWQNNVFLIWGNWRLFVFESCSIMCRGWPAQPRSGMKICANFELSSLIYITAHQRRSQMYVSYMGVDIRVVWKTYEIVARTIKIVEWNK